jgi:hypothetical protein
MHYSWAIDVRIHGSSICPWNPYFCRFIVTLAWVLGQLLALLFDPLLELNNVPHDKTWLMTAVLGSVYFRCRGDLLTH